VRLSKWRIILEDNTMAKHAARRNSLVEVMNKRHNGDTRHQPRKDKRGRIDREWREDINLELNDKADNSRGQ